MRKRCDCMVCWKREINHGRSGNVQLQIVDEGGRGCWAPINWVAEVYAPMFWRGETRVLRLYFFIDLKKVVNWIKHNIDYGNVLLTFLSEGGTVTPRGTEKHNPVKGKIRRSMHSASRLTRVLIYFYHVLGPVHDMDLGRWSPREHDPMAYLTNCICFELR